MVEQWIISVLESHTYLGLFVILMICGLGAPLPEDIPLVTSGYLSYLGMSNIWWTMAVAMVGVMVGDTGLFFIGRRLGEGVTRSPLFGRLLTPRRYRKLRERFDRQGARVVFFSRFMAGIRGAMFLTAGVSGMSYRVFFIMDFIAALITVPLLVFLGNLFGDKIDWIRERVREGELAIMVLIVVAIAAYVIFEVWRHRRRKKEKPQNESPVLESEEPESLPGGCD